LKCASRIDYDNTHYPHSSLMGGSGGRIDTAIHD